jgi:hypothetical protein
MQRPGDAIENREPVRHVALRVTFVLEPYERRHLIPRQPNRREQHHHRADPKAECRL